MGALNVILLVLFVIVCVLLVLLVLVQDDEKGGMGGLLGGSSTAAFGAHSATVLTKATRVLVIAFMVLAFALAFLNKKTDSATELKKMSEAASEQIVEETEAVSAEKGDWWKSENNAEEATTEAAAPAAN